MSLHRTLLCVVLINCTWVAETEQFNWEIIYLSSSLPVIAVMHRRCAQNDTVTLHTRLSLHIVHYRSEIIFHLRPP